jgi:hypothetical protein
VAERDRSAVTRAGPGRGGSVARRGRPPLAPEAVEAKVRAYCARYRVTPGSDGLPPFPSGRRETPQHREWLTVYRAHQRLARRAAAAEQTGGPPPAAKATSSLSVSARAPATAAARCAVCGREEPRRGPVGRYRSADGHREVPAHAACAELLRQAEAAGRDAVLAAAKLLWPGRR